MGWRCAGGGRAVDDEGLHTGPGQEARQLGLRFQELGEDDRAALDAGQRRNQAALFEPTAFQRRLLAPGPRGGGVGKFFQGVAPGVGTAAGGLQEQTPPKTGLAGVEAGQAGAQLGVPFFPKGPLGVIGGEEHRLGAARGKLQAGVGAGVADHNLAQKAAQLLRFAGLARAFGVHEAGPEFPGGGQLAGLQEGDEVVEFIEGILDGSGGEQE